MILALQSSTSVSNDWWASLKHGGLLIAPSKLNEFFVAESLPALPRWIEDRLRRDVTRLQNGEDEHLSTLLDTVLEDVLGLTGDWQKGSQVDRLWSYPAITREIIRPRRVWQSLQGDVLPVFVADGQDGGKVARLGIGRGKRSVTRVVEWLRKANQKVALLTNGYQWRLIHAGADYDAWCEWDITFWFEEGQPGLQVRALRLLLGVQSLQARQASGLSPLIAAIDASRQGQGEISEVLGERVRQAVELLIRESSESLTQLQISETQPVSSRHIYIAATRIIMRCVVILFAEARDLLPRDNPIYHSAYGLQGLREQLDRRAGGRATERLRQGVSAWSRLLALFKLVYEGCAHEALPVPQYGGGLFALGDRAAKDPVLRALYAFENSSHPLSDTVVYRILELLCRSKVRVRQGRSSTWVEAPVDFSDLSSEYIGILYEGLLDFELRQAEANDPIIFLNLGDQPALPLTRLEGMSDKALATLVEKLKQKEKGEAGEEGEAEVEEEETEAEEEAEIGDDSSLPISTDALLSDDDQAIQLHQRAHQWAVRAVEVGKLVTAPRSKKPEALAAYEKAVNQAAAKLIARVVLPGEWFLVRWGGTRKGSGTFYTDPRLALPTTRLMLQPLLYLTVEEVNQANGEVNGEAISPSDAKAITQIPRLPEDILKLKVCDPAMGSGSFLLAALRYLADALYESLHYYDRIPLNGTQVLCRLPDGKETNLMSDRTLPVPPDHPEFESRLKAALKRFLVEWCIYGVDIDPLAVEFARLSLWVETMDRTLSFSFLDHKLKCGNSLVGCWFEQFQDYPVMAWERDGGDKDHDRFVHHFREFVVAKGKKQGQTQKSGDVWNQAIKDMKASVIRSELKEVVSGQLNLFADWTETPKQTHAAALKTYQETHLAVFNPQEQELTYRQKLEDREEYQKLRQVFDTWCAVWFWSPEYLEIAPTPRQFDCLSPETARIVGQLTEQHQFFHWELEFPDVFQVADSGFDAVIGNPPWDTLQPNSREFFSNIDPLYRTYGKQEALLKQQEFFEQNPNIEREWLAYCDRFKALANWSRFAACPFGDYADEELVGGKFSLSRSAKESMMLHDQWRRERAEREGGFTTCHFPFRRQGEGKPYTYKLFSELSYTIARNGGRFGFIIPSGIYSDKGAARLRDLFLKRCNWTHLYAFQNERFVFGSVHHSFKMVVAAVTKGSETEATATRFRLGPGDSPEAYELVEDILNPDGYLPVSVATILQFSPNTGALLEIRTKRDLMILEKMYANGILLGNTSPQGWGIQYRQGDFNMTSDSKLFPPRPQWEAKGYWADEYGHWLKGNWREAESQESEVGVIRSVDGQLVISIDEVEDIALPLYQGVMVHQFDFSRKGWISGTGLRAIWRDIPYEQKQVESQFVIRLRDFKANERAVQGLKIAFRDIARSTDERTFIGGLVPDFPCGNVLGVLGSERKNTWSLLACMNSSVFDWNVRQRMSGTHLNLFVIEELPLLPVDKLEKFPHFLIWLASLCFISNKFAPEWLKLKIVLQDELLEKGWQQLWAITPYERLRLRAILDAVVAHLYGLDTDDFAWILRDCDHPIERVNDKAIARTFDPKGFWRVDKDKPPELRHTVLSQVAFQDLTAIGLEAFLNFNDGEGWMLPEKLRLADYGLGNSDRANEFVPVAEKMGDRFLPWQLEGTPEESWAECERHAENLKRLLGDQSSTVEISSTSNSPLFTNPKQLKLIEEQTQQLGLFDTLEQ